MANKVFLVNLDLHGNQLINARWEVLSSAPANPQVGQIYFDSTLKLARTWNGTAWIDQASNEDMSEVKQSIAGINKAVAENKVTAADKTLVVTPGHTEDSVSTGTTVALNIKAGINDLKKDEEGVYVTPYTADEQTITKSNNQFSVKDGVFDANGAAENALRDAKTYTDDAKNELIGKESDTHVSNTITGAHKAAEKALTDAKAYTDNAISGVKTELIGTPSDNADKDTIEGAKAYADNAANTVKEDLIGDPNNESTADTFVGVRKYAEEKASAAQTAAEATAGTLADAAKNAAIEAAASDATSKANAAQSAAEATAADLATTAKNDAIAAAAADATSKANAAQTAAEATAKGYADAVEAKLPTLVEGNGITISSATDGSGKKTFTVSADASVFQFRGSVEPVPGQTTEETLNSQYGEGKKYTEKLTGDAWAYGSADSGHVMYAWDGDEWILIGAAEGVSGVDKTETAEGVKLTHVGGAVGIDTANLGTKLNEMKAATQKVAGDLAQEITDRTNGDTNTLNSAKEYADAITVNGKSQTSQAITVLGSDTTVSATDTRKVDVAIKAAQDAADAAKTTADNNKTAIDNYTVNGKKISTNPVLAGSDINVTNYSKATSVADVTAADSVNVAIGKVEKKADKGISDAAQALVDAKKYADDQIKEAVGAGVHTYSTVVSSGSTATILATTHKCGLNPLVQCYLGGSLVEVAVSINASGDVVVAWNGTLSSELKITMVGTPTV